MKVLVTGAAGFIGATLARLLLEQGAVRGQPLHSLALLDRSQPVSDDARVQRFEGDLGDTALRERVRAFAPQVVFHLAAIPGGASEADYAAGRRINLEATLALFEALAGLQPVPVVVYASSIAVYGTDLPAIVTPDTPLRPPITYGAHKLACELLLADFSRRGQLDGRSLRLPGIVARARSGAGLSSAFMSDIIQALAVGEPFTCPVSPEATAWWMSARRCAENLLHAAAMDVSNADPRRAWPLPVLRLSIAQLVDTLASLYGADRRALVHYAPQPALEAVYGRYPVLDDAAGRALGLTDDGSPADLVRRALQSASEHN